MQLKLGYSKIKDRTKRRRILLYMKLKKKKKFMTLNFPVISIKKSFITGKGWKFNRHTVELSAIKLNSYKSSNDITIIFHLLGHRIVEGKYPRG